MLLSSTFGTKMVSWVTVVPIRIHPDFISYVPLSRVYLSLPLLMLNVVWCKMSHYTSFKLYKFSVPLSYFIIYYIILFPQTVWSIIIFYYILLDFIIFSGQLLYFIYHLNIFYYIFWSIIMRIRKINLYKLQAYRLILILKLVSM